MKGGFNKLLRNIVAGSSDTEFEKVSFLQISYMDQLLISAWQKLLSIWIPKNLKKSTLFVSDPIQLLSDSKFTPCTDLLQALNGDHKD